MLRPDIAGWRRERVSTYPTERPVRMTPDWVCEVLSPGTAARDQGDKRVIHQRAKVPWYWIVDPTNRSLSVYRLTGDGYVLDTSVGDRGAARLRRGACALTLGGLAGLRRGAAAEQTGQWEGAHTLQEIAESMESADSAGGASDLLSPPGSHAGNNLLAINPRRNPYKVRIPYARTVSALVLSLA